MRALLKAVIEASEVLAIDADLRAGWRDLLENLADIPSDGEVLLDHRDAAPDCRLGHTALLCCVYTAGEIGLGSPREARELAVRTLRGIPERTSRAVADYPFDIPTWNDDCCWPNLIGYAARLGLAEQARDYLYDYGIFQHLKPNGLFAFDCPVGDGQRLTRWGMPDSNEAMTATVSEMLLQSHDGVIRLAPACPGEWDARLERFLAVGAFEVDADIVAGGVRSLSVRSLRGNPCRLADLWPGRATEIRSSGRGIPFDQRDGIIEFQTEADGVYEVSCQEAPSPRAPAGGDDGAWGPVCYAGPEFVGDVPPEERQAVWLGLPGPRSKE